METFKSSHVKTLDLYFSVKKVVGQIWFYEAERLSCFVFYLSMFALLWPVFFSPGNIDKTPNLVNHMCRWIKWNKYNYDNKNDQIQLKDQIVVCYSMSGCHPLNSLT